MDALHTIQRLEEELAGASPERARDILTSLVESVTLTFHYGKARKNGQRETRWTEYAVRWVPEFAAYMDLPEVTHALVGDWKKHPIGTLTFEELEKQMRGR